MYRKIALCSLLVSALLFMSLAGCASKVTKENYDKIKVGMTLAEVEKVLGKGELQAGASGGIMDVSGSAKVYKWVVGEKAITITFVNDKVTAYHQTGL